VIGGSLANAADLPPRPAGLTTAVAPIASPLEFTFAAYLWGAGLNGDVATLPPLPPVHVNLGFDDLLRNLDGAVMAAGEVRKDRFIVAFDVMYTKVSGSADPKSALFNSAALETSSFIGTLLAGYRAVDTSSYSLDLMAGLRGYSVWTATTTTSVLPALNLRREDTEGWVDPMIGAKLRVALDPKWYLTAWGFVGGFGVSSDISWDVMAGVGYAFSKHWSGMLGYRALGVDYRSGAFVYDIVQHGPLFALIAKF
jgi:hypothetical protein